MAQGWGQALKDTASVSIAAVPWAGFGAGAAWLAWAQHLSPEIMLGWLARGAVAGLGAAGGFAAGIVVMTALMAFARTRGVGRPLVSVCAGAGFVMLVACSALLWGDQLRAWSEEAILWTDRILGPWLAWSA